MEDPDRENSVMKTMIFFSLAMLSLPIFLYFFSKSFLFEGEFSQYLPSILHEMVFSGFYGFLHH
jgi:hypothetical protein